MAPRRAAAHPTDAGNGGAARRHGALAVGARLRLAHVTATSRLAEDAAHEAFALAAERWPRSSQPENPTGWLITAPRNRAIDRIRRQRTLAAKTEQLKRELRDRPEEPLDDTLTFPDERLELIFTCCHPALALDAQVALRLRALGGLSTEEIARASWSRRRR